MSSPSAASPYAGYRFPAEVISHAVWLYFRFPLGLRMVEEMLAARGIAVSHETVRQWALKFGQEFPARIRQRLPRIGDRWHSDEVVIKISGVKHWPRRAVDQTGMVLDVLVQIGRVLAAGARWVCEQMHQQIKNELGLDHFEGRSWRGLHHHALLCRLAFAFLQRLRLGGRTRGPAPRRRPAARTVFARGEAAPHGAPRAPRPMSRMWPPTAAPPPIVRPRPPGRRGAKTAGAPAAATET